MKNHLKRKISDLVHEKLSSEEMEDIIYLLRQAMGNNLSFEDDLFFKNLAYEMTGDMKELASLIIDFRQDLKSKIHPNITDIATKYIPQATDQLESIIEATAKAANKIMDNLESMEEESNKMKESVSSLKESTARMSGKGKGGVEITIDEQATETISPLIASIEVCINNHMSLISDSFLQMSFQDLTGQRIKAIIKVVSRIEEKVKEMIISFGIRLNEKQKRPDISEEELQRAVDEKVTELAGPQEEGQGLDQAGIDELLANL
ncbi:MAG: protein phosphatase CheZ [Deltaproteobacteria bacterium]|nr:protein phosphatase CheZ [Deltaproteobacteria bacterium]MBW2340081.1 protein phosphatase CheZ [Deltaproteobacteria bacterium]